MSWLTTNVGPLLLVLFHVALFEVDTASSAQLKSIHSYNGVDVHSLPSQIVQDVKMMNAELGSVAHILRASPIKSTSSVLRFSFDLSTLPSYCTDKDMAIMDQLFFDLKNIHQNSTADHQDLWIADSSNGAPLARVFLGTRRAGYQRIILGAWSKSQQSAGVQLSMRVKPGPLRARYALGPSPQIYLAIFTNRLMMNMLGTIPLQVPRPITCHAHAITLSTDDVLWPRRLKTNVCSPLDDVTFPYNDSAIFDIGKAVRKHLTLHPLAEDSKVLRNPKCCHPVRAGPVSVLNIRYKELFSLENAVVIECGCQNT